MDAQSPANNPDQSVINDVDTLDTPLEDDHLEDDHLLEDLQLELDALADNAALEDIAAPATDRYALRWRGGTRAGSVDAEGKVYDMLGMITGRVEEDGRVRNYFRSVVGIATHAGKVRRDKTQPNLGAVYADGKVRDRTGLVVGTVDLHEDLDMMHAAGAALLLFFASTQAFEEEDW